MSSANDNPIVSALSEDLAAFASDGHVRRYRAGDVIFSAGEIGNGFFVVESGQVRIAAGAGEGGSRTLAMIGPGDFFGEMAIVDDAPRSATATAETEATTVFLQRDTLLKLLERRPQLALYIIREFSNRMRALNEKYVQEILDAERLAAIGRLAGTIVHDFKNPLTVVRLATELACAPNTAPNVRENAHRRIGQQVDRMTAMLQELIEFSRPSALRPTRQRLDFAAFMQPLAAEIKEEIADRRVKLELANPPPALAVPLEPTRISRLLFNLCNNAVDEMRGGGTLTLRFTTTPQAIQVDVQDTGNGIAPEIADTLFQPFTTHGKTNGTGLGLTIAKKIVDDHGGRIWATCEPGRGATFSFTLPRD